jgi:hypothetical protein
MKYTTTPFQKIVLALNALIAFYLAYRGLVTPVELMASLNIDAGSPEGVNEIRGQYGGFFLFVGVGLVLAFIGFLRPSAMLLIMVLLYGGVLTGRVLTLFIDGVDVYADYSTLLKGVYIFDIVGLVLSGLAWQGTRKLEG